MSNFKTELLKNMPHVKFTWELHRPDSNYDSLFFERGEEKAT